MEMPWAAGFAAMARSSTLHEFHATAAQIGDSALRTPFIPLIDAPDRSLRLKAENLQPYGSFKIRSGLSALAAIDDARLEKGVATVSAGNFAQGLAFAARKRGARLTAHVQAGANKVKLDALKELGAIIVPHDPSDWMRIAFTCETGQDDGLFVHPVCNLDVVLGNGTIALEMAADWPEMDTVVAPVGGGGLISGVALAFRALGRKVRVIGCEVEGSAPLAAAKRLGRPVEVARQTSFVDAIGSTTVLAAMWPLLDELVDDVVVVSLDSAKAAMRRLAMQHHLIVEGAGAVALAAGLSDALRGANAAVILSGGNIDATQFCQIMTESDGSK